MDERDPVLRVECAEPGGTVVRAVRPALLTRETLFEYYEKSKEFDVLFNDLVPNDPVTFAEIFLGQDGSGRLFAKGLIWEVDDVGIIYVTNITTHSALAHFTFWDRRIRGREDLLKQMLKFGFERYGFQRIEVRVGLYAKPILYLMERIGFTKEGRLRKATRYNGEWFDANLYSILREEILNGIRG